MLINTAVNEKDCKTTTTALNLNFKLKLNNIILRRHQFCCFSFSRIADENFIIYANKEYIFEKITRKIAKFRLELKKYAILNFFSRINPLRSMHTPTFFQKISKA